jgi:hypothetical protein
MSESEWEATLKSPREIFETQYKDAAAEGAIIELHMRLLADKVPALQKIAHDRLLKDVETLIVEHFASVLTEDEKQTLERCRQLRNKILHCDFKAARKKLQQIGAAPSRGDVKKIDISGLSGKEMLQKLTSAAGNVAGTFEYVADLPAGPGSVFGWLIEVGQAGDFVHATDAFRRGVAIVDRLAET